MRGKTHIVPLVLVVGLLGDFVGDALLLAALALNAVDARVGNALLDTALAGPNHYERYKEERKRNSTISRKKTKREEKGESEMNIR